MSILTIQGDATHPIIPEGKRCLIAHVCNDIGAWGAGFVMAISKRWHKPQDSYYDWYKAGDWQGIPFLLGNNQVISVEPNISVVNMIAQHGIRSSWDDVPLRYSALGVCLNKLVITAKESDSVVCMPKIGAGLAGGDWRVIYDMLEYRFNDGPDLTVYVL